MFPVEGKAVLGMPEIVAGQVLAGKYRVERVLGVGGMGMVVAALHLQLDERVAIKFMLPEAFANADAVARFAREARAAVKIKSEHVARVSDVGVFETGEPYMVMEYLEGSDLSAWLKQQGKLSIEQAVEFVLQAGEAIAEAHSLGIVHRDLKPANLFVIRRPSGGFSVKVLDFGISKVTRSDAPDFGVTKSSATMGSPLYMSPELISDARQADARCDIWALGVILYELISGATPFLADNLFNVMLRIAQSAPTPLRTLVPQVPPALEAAVMKCLEKDPNRRYANVAQLAAALIAFAPVRARISLERISGVFGPGELITTQLESGGPPPLISSNAISNPSSASWARTSANRSPNRRALIGLSIAALLAAAISGAMFLARRSPRSVAQTASSAEPATKPEPMHENRLASGLTAAAAPLVSTSPVSEPSAGQPALSASASTSAAAISPAASVLPKRPPPATQRAKDPTPNPGNVYDDRK